MASLVNLHTGNYPGRMLYPDTMQRMNAIGQALHQPRDWDVPRVVPVANIDPADPTLRVSAHPDPRFTEHYGRRAQQFYVPVVPRDQRMLGDNTESILLYQPRRRAFWSIFRKERYAPY